MKRALRLWSVAAALVATAAAAETLDEIVAKNLAARGGKDKIQAVQTIKMTGKQIFGPQEAPFTLYWKRPGKLRVEFTLQGLTGVQAYDGATGWAVMPFLGKTDPEKMSEEDMKDVKDQAAEMLDGPFLGADARGSKLELLGKEEIEGTPAWKIKVTRASGDFETYYLDADAFLEIKTESKRKMRDQEVDFESAIGDYKEVSGLTFPFSIENKPKGAPQGQTITVEKIEVNADVPDSLFVMPEVKPAEPAKPSN